MHVPCGGESLSSRVPHLQPVPVGTSTGSLAPTKVREFLAFLLAGEEYAVELDRIREIVSAPELTNVPRAPADVMGLCSVRGLLVTVIDLRRRLSVPETEPTRLARVLLSETDSGEVVGLFVDEVKQVIRLPASDIEIAQSVLGNELSDYVLGIGRPHGDVVVLLDFRSITG